MYKYINTYKAKAVLCFCLILIASSLKAQNTGHYKYSITPTDTCPADNVDILEVNNKYYLLTKIGTNRHYRKPCIVVFDENLNSIEQISLSEIDSAFYPN